MISRSLCLAAAIAALAAPCFAQAQAPQQPDREQTARFGNPTVPHQAVQPQGPTGPLDTTSGGAPAGSPQGDTPPGMQPVQHEPTGEGKSSEPKQPPLR